MIRIDELLKPVSEERPAGDDCGSGDLSLQLHQLEEQARGTPGQERIVNGQMVQDPPSEPKWLDVQKSAVDLLGQSKHLRVATILTLAALRTNGLAGLREGLMLIDGLVRHFWPTLWPALDPADGNDPQERLNLLGELGGGRFVRYFEDVVVGQSNAMGVVRVSDLLRAQNPTGQESGPALTAAQVDAILRDTDAEQLKATGQIAGDIKRLIGDMRPLFNEVAGAGQVPDWTALADRCDRLEVALAPYVQGAASPVPKEEETAAPGNAEPRAASPLEGRGIKRIHSRGDVVKALDELCRYYQQNEPSSPVPLLLRRAQRLAKMDFVEALNELLPDSVSQLKTIAGQLPEPPNPDES